MIKLRGIEKESTLLIECKDTFDKDIPASSYKIMSDLNIPDISPIAIEGNSIVVFLNALLIAEVHLLNNSRNAIIATFSTEYDYRKDYSDNQSHSLVKLTDCLLATDETGVMKLLHKDNVKLSILHCKESVTVNQMYMQYGVKDSYHKIHRENQIAFFELNSFRTCDELLASIENILIKNKITEAAIALIDNNCIIRQLFCVKKV